MQDFSKHIIHVVYFTSSFFIVSNIIGVAINKDEYVPTTTPTIKANIKPLITSPPKMKITSNTKNVVNEVIKVRLRVLFKAALTISAHELYQIQQQYHLMNNQLQLI